MKLRMGTPKYGSLWGSFLLVFCISGYLGSSDVAMLGMAGFMAAFLAGMIAERREHEARQKGSETVANV